MTDKVKSWWSEDGQWFCMLVDDGVSKATVSLTPAEASHLALAIHGSAQKPCSRCFLEQEHRDSGWIALSASERACYDWPDDTDIHKQCRAAYIAGATDYALPNAPAQGWQDPAARWIEEKADLLTNSLHCGDNSLQIHLAHKYSDTLRNLAKEIRALAAPSTTRDTPDPTRCEICDWPLAESPEKGCVPGDCSYRPDDPAEQERIRKRRVAVASTNLEDPRK